MPRMTEKEIERSRGLREGGLTYSQIGEWVGRSAAACRRAVLGISVQNEGNQNGPDEKRALVQKLQSSLCALRETPDTPPDAALPARCRACRWRMNKAAPPVCAVCYREKFDKSESEGIQNAD